MDENQKNHPAPAPGSTPETRPAAQHAGPLRVAMSPTFSHGQTAMKIGERIYSAEPEEVGELGDDGLVALGDGRLMLVDGSPQERDGLMERAGKAVQDKKDADAKTGDESTDETNRRDARNAQPKAPSGDRSSSLSGQPVPPPSGDSGPTPRAGATSREKRES